MCHFGLANEWPITRSLWRSFRCSLFNFLPSPPIVAGGDSDEKSSLIHKISSARSFKYIQYIPLFLFFLLWVIHTSSSTPPYPSNSIIIMVLGFGSKSRKKGKGSDTPHVVRMSPSLPEMKSQGIPWPANLVDVAAIRQSPPPDQRQVQGAAKVSFSSPDRSAIPFHRPFRMSPSKSTSAAENGRPSIASIYMSHPPSAYPTSQIRSPTSLSLSSKQSTSHRRVRVAPTFNLMVRFRQYNRPFACHSRFMWRVYRSLARKEPERWVLPYFRCKVTIL